MIKMTRKEYESRPSYYRGQVDGTPYLLRMDQSGKTAYSPVKITDDSSYIWCKKCQELRKSYEPLDPSRD